MARLPPLVDLAIGTGGVPQATAFGDVYFSVEDGLAETRTVFLDGAGLPQAWAGAERFCVGELGFGSGLNILALMQLWAETRPSPTAQLDVLSVEGFPMTATQAAATLAPWEQLNPWRDWLLAHWPSRARGVRRLVHDGLNLALTLVIDEVEAGLAAIPTEAEGPVQAWFLDGFAPARNPEMWSERVLGEVRRLSAPGARLASFTAAGVVRRGLAAQGFAVERLAGFGRKRHRLHAHLPAPEAVPRSEAARPRSALVLGGGIAGASLAQSLSRRGVRVQVLEAGPSVAHGASGNPLGLVMPRLDAVDGPLSRALIDAFLFARSVWLAAPPEVREPIEVEQTPQSDTERKRFARLLADPPFDPDDLAALDPDDPSAGLLLGGCLIVRPAELVRHCLVGTDVRLNTRISRLSRSGQGWQALAADGAVIAEADIAIWCGGAGLMQLPQLADMRLAGRAGQVDWSLLPQPAEPAALTSSSYALRWGSTLLFGATFNPTDSDVAVPEPAAQAANLSALARLAPDWHRAIFGDGCQAPDLRARASVRATTPDRFPIVGPLGDVPGQYVLTGLGARGLVWAPYLAEDLASRIFGEPALMTVQARARLAPDRWKTPQRPSQREGGTS